MFCKKGALKKFAKFPGKHLYWSLFFNKVEGAISPTLLKRDSGAGAFMLIWCEIFKGVFFPGATLVIFQIK